MTGTPIHDALVAQLARTPREVLEAIERDRKALAWQAWWRAEREAATAVEAYTEAWPR